MNSEFINMTIGVAIGAIPFSILWAMANRRANDWKYLAEQMDHEAERAQHNFNSMYCQYLQLLALFQSKGREEDKDADWWKQN